ncbi:MAG: outer membrane lipoprotein carrier protein LolA [Bacilli bacterium]|jgi:outer membrane lipoprotein-sorting protein|nr:outer membrane lipoprotein carrier protein LolA [Bacilli bacterium]
MINNETTYEYDVKSTYKETNNFKVELTNKINDHKQIILRNKEGVYVVTPSLNKSFKFQSEWPYNNSQVYLLQSIMQDIKNDKNRKIKIDDNKKIIESSVNYINNKKLVKQKVIFSKKNIMKSVEVYNDDGIVQIRINFEKIKLNPKIEDDVFNLDKNISLEVEEKELPTGKIEDIIYPMYLPEDTKLTNQQKFNIENGERVILTFSNEDNKTMTFIQETANNDENIVSVDGNLSHIGDVIGVINEEYLYWNTNGVDYYLISNSIENDQLLEVAKSINTVSVIK